MKAISPKMSYKARLDKLTRRWWIYLLLCLLFFIPPYVANGYAPGENMKLIEETLLSPFILAARALMPLAKLMPILLLVALFQAGNRVGWAYTAYVTLVYLAIALFQNATRSDQYGLIILTGNVALILVTTLSWASELVVRGNDYSWKKLPVGRWWVLPLALLALLSPIDPQTLTLDFNLRNLITNEAGLTYCMFTPWVLAVLTLFYPRVNLSLMRVASFTGILFGLINVIVWFGLNRWGWWMGVLHLPLLSISIYGFILSIRKNR